MAILYAQDWRDYDTFRKAYVDIDRDGELIKVGGSVAPVLVPTGSVENYQNLRENNYPVGSNSDFRSFERHRSGSGGGSSLYGLDFAKDADGIRKVAFSLIMGGGSSSPSYPSDASRFIVSRNYRESDANTSDTSFGYRESGFGIINTSSSIDFVHTVQTSQTASNSLIIAKGPALRESEFYHIECEIDITLSLATFKAYVNGEIVADAQFDRDRIVNQFTTNDIATFKWGLGGGYVNMANLVIYTPDAETSFPMGPLEIGRISPTSGPEFQVVDYDPNASDGGWHVIPPGGEAVWGLSDIPEGHPVLFAEMRGRVAAGNGFTPSVMDIELQRADGTISAATVREAPSGSYERAFRATVPDADKGAATLNGMRIAVKARTEN